MVEGGPTLHLNSRCASAMGCTSMGESPFLVKQGSHVCTHTHTHTQVITGTAASCARRTPFTPPASVCSLARSGLRHHNHQNRTCLQVYSFEGSRQYLLRPNIFLYIETGRYYESL